MNNNIEQMMLDATANMPQGYYVPYQYWEKFAEMIIKECIRVPYDMWDKAELNADVAVKIEHRIKQRFGVE